MFGKRCEGDVIRTFNVLGSSSTRLSSAPCLHALTLASFLKAHLCVGRGRLHWWFLNRQRKHENELVAELFCKRAISLLFNL